MSTYSFDPGGLTGLNFQTPGHIYRSPMPFGPYDADRSLFQAYQAASISAVVVLAETEECLRKTGINLLRFYREQGLEVIHCPIPDYAVPNRESFDKALQAAVERSQAGKHIVVHCTAGVGRTGIFMACLAHRLLGMDGNAAIEWVRQVIPTAIETVGQKQFVMEFAG